MNNPEKDYENISAHILKFEALSEQGITKKVLTRYQAQLDKISSHYQYDDSISYLYVAFYELQAHILMAQNDNEAAIKFLTEAAEIMAYGQSFVSKGAQDWYNNELEAAANWESEAQYNKSNAKQKLSKNTKIILFCSAWVLVLLFIVVSGPLSDNLTIRNANPTMLKLAQDAGMTRKGELLFLRTNPQLVSDSTLTQVCPNSQSSKGFIEQGCYVPNQSDPTTGRIYLRQMTPDFYNLEVTTAVYEMLHPAYIILSKDSSTLSNLNKSIENNLSSLSDSNLTAQVSNFATSEPGARDLELFSILGTEYSGVTSDLTYYYGPYVTDISNVVSMNNQIFQTFKDDQAQLTQLQNTINTDNSQANTAYANSISWADAGNQYEDNYNYNLYAQDLAAANTTIDQYNTLLNQYNILVDEFNGPQFNSDTQVQSQQSH